MCVMQREQVNQQNPQSRLIAKAVLTLQQGGLVIYPTDTTYALGCDIYAKRSIERLYELKGLNSDHPLAFLCGNLSELARYAVIENQNYRVLRRLMPGPYTFVLPATREVPKILQSKTRTVGVRIDAHPVCTALLGELGHPLVTTTVTRVPHTTDGAINDPDTIVAMFKHSVEVFLDVGVLLGQSSTVLDLTGDKPKVLRYGAGDVSWLEA